ncbi:MAG: cation diffusion facilitator family transporter [bacterium]|nr:cation diffusion facilitator family transporter [bacterium]
MESTGQTRYKDIKFILFITLLLNWLVAFAKIFYGIYTNCMSMTADGFHSLTDGASNIIGLVGIAIASKPIDKDHPYGHKKYETFASLSIAGLLSVVCFNLIRGSINRFLNPAAAITEVDYKSFIIMIATMTVNVLVMRYELKKGKELKSDFLVSDALHTKSDIFTSLSVLTALAAIKLGYPIFDPIAAIIISFFIAHAAYGIIKEGSQVLCDTAVIDDNKIKNIVLSINGVEACHKIRSRGRPDDIHLDLHVQINPETHIDKAHEISNSIETTIKINIKEITDVVVHMEPLEKK